VEILETKAAQGAVTTRRRKVVKVELGQLEALGRTILKLEAKVKRSQGKVKEVEADLADVENELSMIKSNVEWFQRQ
jgi:peptidoglycan hydrolase CwlO-like protein